MTGIEYLICVCGKWKMVEAGSNTIEFIRCYKPNFIHAVAQG